MASNASNITIDFLNFENFITPWNERVTCVIIYVLCTSVGVITNGIAAGLSIFTDLCKNKINILIANMAICDFIYTGVFMIGQSLYILYRETMPQTGCTWLAFINFIAAMQEFVFPPILAINRYIGLYHNEIYEKIYSKTNMALMICGTWGFCTCIPLLFTLMGRTGYDHRNEHCCIVMEGNLIWLVITGPLVGVCDTTMIFCNWKIYKLLKDHGSKHGTMLEKTVVSENREIMYFMVIDTIIAILVHTLYHTCKFLILDRFSLFLRVFFTAVCMANAGLRGIIILTLLRPYRNAFKKYILRKEPNQVTPNHVMGMSVGGTTSTRNMTGKSKQ